MSLNSLAQVVIPFLGVLLVTFFVIKNRVLFRANISNHAKKVLVPASFVGLILLIGSLVLSLLPSSKMVTVSAASTPIVTGSIPSAVSIGEQFQFTLNFYNTGASEGYAPYIDLFVPITGTDGATTVSVDDGIVLNSASYLGVNLPIIQLPFPETGVGCSGGLTPVTHPFAVDNTNSPVIVCGNPGDSLAVVTLPFGSFVPAQSFVPIQFSANVSNLADSDTPLTLQYRGGFRFGNDALNNPLTDPTVVGNIALSNVNPVLFSINKTYNGPENETATGPNYKRRYTVSANLANGQTVTNLVLTDKLPNNLSYLNIISSSPAGGVITEQPTIGAASNAPTNQLSIEFPSVTGTNSSADASMTFEYYVPDNDANGNAVINHTTGDDSTSIDDASATALWTPTDIRDGATTITSDSTPNDHTLTNKSIAIQKRYQNITQVGNHPGDTIRYSMDIQISDYFAFENLIATDIFSDGQSFDTSFTPTLTITESGAVSTGNMNMSNVQYTRDTGYSGASGNTTVLFNISNELVSRGLDGKVLGGCAGNLDVSLCANNVGAATATLVFQTKIDDQFTDSYGTGNPNLDMGDTLSNNVTIRGDVLNNSTLVATGQSEADTSGVNFDIVIGSLEKTIYAINGNTTLPSPVKIGPGDEITYRLKYNLTLTDTENFYMEDFLPLPALVATGFSSSFDTTISATPPAAGTAKFGPADTFYAISNITPTVSTSTPENKIKFDFGAFQDSVNQSAVSDILLTVVANNQPFADGLNLVNQARARATNTFNTEQTANAIVPVVLTVPDISLKKGVVATTASTPVYTPTISSPATFSTPSSTACTIADHRFSGNINSANLATNPIDSNVAGADAGDSVTFALTLENKGTGPRGAFDLKVRDVLPAGMEVGSTGIDLCITRGDGTPLTYVPVNNSESQPLFGSGIEIVDPSAMEGAVKAYNPANPSSADNVIIVSYNLTLSSTVSPRQTFENTAHVFNYSGANGGTANFVPNGSQSDTATVTTSVPSTSKTIIGTNQADSTGNNVLVGEIVTYQVQVTVPEGTMNATHIFDTLDSGLALVGINSITASSNVSTNVVGGFSAAATSAVITNSGQNIDIDLGNITNSDVDNSTAETITIIYQVVVTNSAASVRNAQLNNAVVLAYNNGANQTESAVFAPNVTVLESQLNIAKTISAATGDGNDLLTYTLTITRTAASNANAYDLNINDVLPSQMTYQAGSLTTFSGVVPSSLTESSGTISATYSALNIGQSSVLQFQVRPVATLLPSQVIPNSATLTYSSLPGNITTAQSPFSAVSTERTGNTLNPGGALNNYTSTSSVNFTVNNVAVAKSVVQTSESSTTATNRLAIGEIVRYHLATTIPESQISNFRVRDNLPAGLQFLDDGTATVGFSSNGNVSSDVAAFSACNQVGSSAAITPTCVIPAGQISGGAFGDGTDPIFSFGVINNTDNDANAEYIVVEFNALVLNVASNQAFNNATGVASTTTLNNTYSAIRAGTPADVTMATTGNVAVQIAEPVIRNLGQTFTQIPIDAGDPFTYRLTFSNTASGSTGNTAFDVALSNLFDSNLQIDSITVVSKPAGTSVTDTSVLASNQLNLLFDKLGLGESVAVEISGFVKNTVSNGQIISNTANLTYSSLPGSGTTSNPTGSNIPNSNSSTSERNGSNTPTLNDYRSSSTLNRSITTGAIVKTVYGNSGARIGDEPEYNITLTLAEGLNKNVRVVDTLPTGLEYISAEVITTQALSGGLFASDFSATLPTPTVTGTNPITFTFGDVTLPSDNDNTNNTFIVRVKTRLQNIPSNQYGLSLMNRADLITQNVSTLADQTISSFASISAIVPVLGITKNFVPSSAAPNDTVSFEITLTNTGDATAYDVSISDTIDTTKLTNVNFGSTPAGFSGSFAPSGSTTLLTYSGGSIAPGQTLTFSVTGILASNLTNGQTVSNTATLAAASTLPGSSVYERTFGPMNATGNLTVQTPDISVSKTDGVAILAPSNTGRYTITASNIGTYKADNVVITETLPANTTFNALASLPTVWTDMGGGVYTTDVGTILASANKVAYFAVTVNNPVPAGANQIVNTVTVTEDGTHGSDPNLANNTATDTDTIIAAPDLVITKTDGVTTAVPTDTLTYTLTISNNGNQDATGVVITDNLPANTAYQSSSDSGFVSGASDQISWPTISLAAGATTTRTVTVTVNATIPAGISSIINNATVSDDGTNGSDPNPGNNSTFDTDTLNAAPDLAITKTDGLTTVLPNDTLSYTLTISNNGNQDATGVIVTDTLPANTTYQSSSNSGSNSSGTITWPTFNLAAGATTTRTVTIKVNATIPAGISSITNTATVADDGTNGTDPTPANNTATDTDTLTANPDLSISKTNSQTVVSPNQTLAYQIAVTNNGNQGASNVLVTETVPLYSMYKSAGSSSWSCGNNSPAGTTCTLAIANINAGQTVNVTFVTLLNATIPTGISSIANTTTVADDGTNGADPTPANNTATDTDTLNAAPDLTITKTNGLTTVIPGQIATYTLTISNNGNQDATGVIITDTLPANTTYQSSSNSGSNSSGTITWPTFNLAAGATTTRTVIIRISSTIPAGISSITNTATAADDGTNGSDPTPANNTATDVDTLNASPELAISIQDGNVAAIPSSSVLYIVDYLNSGVQNATGVVVTFTVPQHTTFDATNSSPGWSCSDGAVGGTICTYNKGNFAVGEYIMMNARVRVNATIPAGVTTTTASTSISDDGANGPEGSMIDNFDFEDTPIIATPDLTITKTNGLTTVIPGQIATYTLTISNNGNQDATGVIITDTLPANTTYQSSSNSGSNSSGTITWPTFNLAAGATTTRTVTIRINSAIPTGISSITNTATVADDGTNGSDPTLWNNNTFDTDTLNASPDLTITKTDNGALATPSNVISYTINYANNGNQTATNVIITETVPEYASYVATGSSAFSCSDGSLSGTTCTLAIGTLNPGESGSATFIITINSTLPAGIDQLSNTVSITDDGTNGPDQNPADNTNTEITTSDATPDLTITKTDNGLSKEPGQTLSYTINYANNGNQTATNVTITETVPEYASYVAAGSSAFSCSDGALSGTTCTLSIGTLTPGQSGTATFVVVVNSTLPAAIDQLSNTVSIADDGTNGTDPNLSNNTATELTPLQAAPNLAITKTDGLTSIGNNQTFTYTLTISNNGNQDATGVIITDTLPANFTPTTISDLGIESSGIITWPGVNITASSQITRTVEGTFSTGATLQAGVEQITNTASVTDDGTNGSDLDGSDNQATDTDNVTGNPDLQVTITDNKTVATTAEIVPYTIESKNVGSQDASNVVLTVQIPTGLQYVSAGSTSGWNCVGSTCTLQLGTVNAASTVNSTIVFQVDSPVSIDSVLVPVSISDDGVGGADPTPANNESSDLDTLVGNPNLTIIKTDGQSVLSAGQETEYTLTVTNNGDIITTGITITDTYPSTLTFVSASNSGANNPTTHEIVWSGITLLPGQSTQVTVRLKLDDAIASGVENIINSASVTNDGTHGSETDTNDNTSSDTNTIDAAPDLTLQQMLLPVSIFPDQVLTYQLDYSNVGNQDSTGVLVSFVIPTNTEYVPTPGWTCSGIIAGSTCTFSVGNLPVGQQGSRNIQVRVLSIINPNNRQIQNTASIADDGNNGSEITMVNNNDLADSLIPVADVSMEKTVDKTQAKLQDQLTYTFTYRNLGPDTATGITFEDTLPTELQFISTTLDGNSISTTATTLSNGQTKLTFAVPDLGPGIEKVLFVRTKIIQVPTGNSIVNNASIKAREVDPELSNNRSGVGVTILKNSDNITTVRTGAFEENIVVNSIFSLFILILCAWLVSVSLQQWPRTNRS